MRTYTVHHRLNDSRDLAREVEDLVFVKDGFCWPGLFFPALWLICRGMWLVLLGYLAVTAAIVIGSGLLGLSQDSTFALGLLTNLVIAFEGNDLRRWTLGRRGLRVVGLVSGRRLADAERRFLASLTVDPRPSVPAKPVRPTAPAGTWARPDPDEDRIGLFPDPDRAR